MMTKISDETLTRYLFGEADGEERAAVERWAAADEARRRELERLGRQLGLATRRYRRGLFDPRAAALRLGLRLGRRRRTVAAWGSVAAAVAVCAGVWWATRTERVTLAAGAGEKRTLLLPDSSRVTLAGGTELSYAAGFESREVEMSGKAYFEVRSGDGAPFTVCTRALRVTALGTAFQVETVGGATEVSVERGRVRVTATDTRRDTTLSAGMAAAYERGEGWPRVEKDYDANRTSWKTGVLRFEGAPLREVVARLNEHYRAGVRVPREWEELELTATFSGATLGEALEIINETLDIRLTE